MVLFILCYPGNRSHVICVTGKIADAGDILSGHWFQPYILCTDVPLLLARVSCERALIFYGTGHWFQPYVLCTDVPLLLARISCERALIFYGTAFSVTHRITFFPL